MIAIISGTKCNVHGQTLCYHGNHLKCAGGIPPIYYIYICTCIYLIKIKRTYSSYMYMYMDIHVHVRTCTLYIHVPPPASTWRFK